MKLDKREFSEGANLVRFFYYLFVVAFLLFFFCGALDVAAADAAAVVAFLSLAFRPFCLVFRLMIQQASCTSAARELLKNL